MVPKQRRLKDYEFTSSTAHNGSRSGKDFGSCEESSPLTTHPSARERLAGDFGFKVRIHSKKKANSNDPKPATLSNEVNLPQRATPFDLIELGDEDRKDVKDEFPTVADDRQFPSTLGTDEIEPFDVGYRRDEFEEYDEFAGMPWLEAIHVVATHTQGLVSDHEDRSLAGFCGAKLIRRGDFRTRFYQQMCRPFDESTLMAFNLFDQYGHLKDHYKHHKFLKGSGAWQAQLDENDILLIEDVTVDVRCRRRGLATAMVEVLLAATRRKTAGGNFAAILWPQMFKEDDFQDLLRTIVSPSGGLFRADVMDHCDFEVTQWARSLGFRRIGLSMWFGLLCRDGTTSAVVPVEYDQDPHILNRVKNLLPDSLYHAQSDKHFLTALHHYYWLADAQDKRWFATDEERNTLLHIACQNFFLKSLTWIMQQSCSEELLKMRNSSRLTPLEATVQLLEAMRTRTLIGNTVFLRADTFEGHTLDQARCVALLRRSKIDSEEDLEQFRYGCTCGECYDGYISPRMNYTLYMNASMERDRFAEELDMSGETFVVENEWKLMHLPDYTMKYLTHYKAMRQGFVNACGHVSDCLLDRLAPDYSTVRFYMSLAQDQQSALVTKFFKNKANIKGVVGMILDKAWSDDEIHGDGWTKEMREDDDEDYDEPECRNDHEFALVARKCGYPSVAYFLTTTSNELILPLS
ncbi:hypothetical protein H2200_005743 [Cladophialophora chaetospira]|uniref:Uncharacterized protein n=1 Tax=Cladophialophora chaetospira TaxID=386627 RepID=A0AA38X9R9_9EURO|nr:hypothetical protein H2200_005743 [Cladophialophora chaetospira]